MNIIEIYNSFGKVVYSDKQSKTAVIQIENLERGNYSYLVTNRETLQTEEGEIFVEGNTAVQSTRKMNEVLKRKCFRWYFYFKNVISALHFQYR